MGKLSARIRREQEIQKRIKQGYTRKAANGFYKRAQRERKGSPGSGEAMREAHESGYLLSSLEKYGCTGECDVVSDLEMQFLNPVNNTFTKWLEDLLTQYYVFSGYRRYLPQVRFSIIDREGEKKFLPADPLMESLDGGYESFLACLREVGTLILAPSRRWSRRSSYRLSCVGEDGFQLTKDNHGVMRMLLNDGVYDREGVLNLIGDQDVLDAEALRDLVDGLEYDWVAYEPYTPRKGFSGLIKLYVATRELENAQVLDAYYLRESHGRVLYQRLDDACVVSDSEKARIVEAVEGMAAFVGEIEFIAVYLVPTEDGFIIDSFGISPSLPPMRPSEELNSYLHERVDRRKAAVSVGVKSPVALAREKMSDKWASMWAWPGMRLYMQKLWMRSVRDDLLHTRKVGMRKKIWAWKRGFLSFRIQQYGLTEENYRDHLSDYQYHWLNRINNDYQVWINDKISIRYVLEPFKQYLAEYYYAIILQDGKPLLKRLQDLPSEYGAAPDDLFRLLRDKGILAMKPSAGTHGDGFYRLEYKDGDYFVNGEVRTEEQMRDLVRSFKSFYVVTEYLFMHPGLRDIYPHSLNTIRVAVTNREATNPRIMQAYMRIGSSSSGFTDNVGYGGICAHIRLEDGYCHSPETLRDHQYLSCPTHPDTGATIERFIPNWHEVCEGVEMICSFMPQLEYLGFDIAVTEGGFKILEINIHQDLHKVAEHSPEFKEFYKAKLRLKAEKHGLKKQF